MARDRNHFSGERDGSERSRPLRQPAGRGPPCFPRRRSCRCRLWIGYALAAVAFAGEMIAIARHPELLDAADSSKDAVFSVPPLEVFFRCLSLTFFGWSAIQRYHKISCRHPRLQTSDSPAKAVGFHFIPFFWLVWIFIWPRKSQSLWNARFNASRCADGYSASELSARCCAKSFRPGMGIALLFMSTAYVGGF